MHISYDFYSGAGGSDLIIFIHGLGCSRKSFRPMIELGDLGEYQILNVDLIGFGKADKPEDFDYKMESQAFALGEFIEKNIEFEKLNIVAHSMGGAVGLLLYDRLKNRLFSFANLEGNLVGSDCDMFSRRVIKFPPDKYASRLFPKHRKLFAGDPAFDFENTTPFAIYRSSESLVKWSDNGALLRLFENLDCRKAYFYGEENKGMPVLEKLGDITKIEIPAAGHCTMTDNPEIQARRIKELIKE